MAVWRDIVVVYWGYVHMRGDQTPVGWWLTIKHGTFIIFFGGFWLLTIKHMGIKLSNDWLMISVCACTSTRCQAQDANAQLKRGGWKPGLGATAGPLSPMARRSRISWEQGLSVSQKSGLGSCSKTSSKEILIDLIWQLILNTLTSLWILLRRSPMNMCLGPCEHR